MDTSNLQQLVTGLQSQAAAINNLIGQAMGQPTPPAANPQDMQLMVRKMLAEELQRYNLPAPAAIQTPQLAAPTAAPAVSFQPIVESTPSMTPQASVQDLMMKEFLTQLKSAIGGCLSPDQQIWVSQNLMALPAFFGTPSGKSALLVVLNQYQQHLGANQPVIQPPAA